MSRPDFIVLDGVVREFGPVRAVDGVDLEVAEGEFLSLLGASGSGKTTLLRIVAGLERPDGGRVLIDGEDVTTVPPERRPTNMVFQSYALFPHLDVARNVGYGLRGAGLGRAARARKIDDALALVRLSGLGPRRPDQLSGGQRQRVALARALVRRPKVLLLDEPLAALDRRLREEMRVELRALQRTVGITFVLVTHDQEEALSLSDRVAVMARGRILQVDTPERLYAHPADREVASFIGTMNLIPGRIVAIEGGWATVDAGPLGPMRAACTATWVRPEASVLVGLRPEALTFGPRADASINRLSGRVAARAFLGDRRHLHVEVPGLEPALIVAAVGEHADLPIGVDIDLGFAPQAALLLAAG
jgi:ABC-type Fe3+/spermidine/putrescine transport system ATPase subunit